VIYLRLNMVLLTMIARIPDGLPLAASMQDDEQVFVLGTIFRTYYYKKLLFSKCFVKSLNNNNMAICNTFILIQVGRKLIEYQNQAKLLFKKLNFQSPKQCTIESVPYYFQ